MWYNGESLAVNAQGACYSEMKKEEKEKQKQNT